jgi:hypothetical protein
MLESGGMKPFLDWSVIHTRLENITSDVLLFLDGCDAVTSVIHGSPESSKPIEIIAGSGYPNTSYGFAKPLANFLRNTAKDYKFEQPSFTAAHVFNHLLQQSVQDNYMTAPYGNLTSKSGSPVHFFLPGNTNQTSISLEPLVSKMSNTRRNSQSQQQGWGSNSDASSRPNGGRGSE